MNIDLEQVVSILVRVGNVHNFDEDHGERTATMAVAIGRRLALPEGEIQLLQYAARLHDLGRVGIDDAIISKPRWLTKSQFAAMREHSVIGYELVKDVLPNEITMAILYHHEHYDGSGYPRGLKGNDIPLFARIICVADTWDALTSERPYRKAMIEGTALAAMNKMSAWFDPVLYAHFLAILRESHE